MFWSGGKIIAKNFDTETMTYKINPEDVFIAIFAIMFGASHSGSAAALGPDMGKALAAS